MPVGAAGRRSGPGVDAHHRYAAGYVAADIRHNPNDLSGVLTSGTFRQDGTRALGTWPLERGFIEGMLGGGL